MYFSDCFGVPKSVLDEYGAFDISLVNDLPLFIDPFLLFNSEDDEYKKLHQDMINYLVFLRTESTAHKMSDGLLRSWYCFPEIKQNWLGFSSVGNSGSGLGIDFARALNTNLTRLFTTFGNESIAKGSHIEKLCLIYPGVGRDNISDFTTNLILEYLLQYTENFALKYLPSNKYEVFHVDHAWFSYNTKSWTSKKHTLPCYRNDYVLLTPKDILTKDETWICRPDMLNDYREIADAMPNIALREQLAAYLESVMPTNASRKDYLEAISKTIYANPEFIEYYIKFKEDNGDQAVSISTEHVQYTEALFVEKVKEFVGWLAKNSDFYTQKHDTYAESLSRVHFLKHVIEDNDGYRLFYLHGKPVRSEKELQLLFRLTWYESPSDINAEVNNGRGPVDYKASRGSRDKTVIEFKLARNSKLKQNLEKQAEIYAKANGTKKIIKVILYFTESEYNLVQTILSDLKMSDEENIVLIDARNDNKPSASIA